VENSNESPYWFQVADLKPALRGHVKIHRHFYRGKRWYVMQDPSTGRFHRFGREAYFFIGLMNGKNTMRAIWDKACQQQEHPPLQDELIQLLSQLHQFDVLRTDIPMDISEMVDRNERQLSQQRKARWRSPLALRFPLIDPDRFLNASQSLIRPLFSKLFFSIWLLLLTSACVVAAMNWPALTEDLTDRVLSTENMLLLWFVYPLVKGLHELGHAYAVKRWGGEVHEMGIMLLVLMPVPYVDASASSAFISKSHRIIVSGAGMAVELLLASVAMLLWVNVEPGLVRAIAFNVMLIAGVSTLMLNGNPLLRFDGYYLLSDWIEIPNLAVRSNRYWGYLAQRYILKIDKVRPPQGSSSEIRWLFFYAPLAFIYRIIISITIALFVAGQFFAVGVAMAVWALFNSLLMPLFKLLKYVASHPTRRARGASVSSGVIAALLVFLFVIPLPSSTLVQGVVWVPQESRIYSSVDGFVAELLVQSGEHVTNGQLLIRLESPELDKQVSILQARLTEYRARYQAGMQEDRAQALVLNEEIDLLEAELSRATERQSSLLIKSHGDGKFLLSVTGYLPGQFLKRGQEIAYVLGKDSTNVRVVVRQDDIDKVRHYTRRVDARMSDNPGQLLEASLKREIPAASYDLPSPVLSLEGGGKFALAPASSAYKSHEPVVTVMEKLFQFDVILNTEQTVFVDERVYVRFQHPAEPLSHRLWSALRRLFMRQFDV